MPEVRKLRDNVVFKIVPMLNPDGVFLGNYRVSSLGVDLNRCWILPAPHWMTPTISAVKMHLLRSEEERAALNELGGPIGAWLQMGKHFKQANEAALANQANGRIAQ